MQKKMSYSFKQITNHFDGDKFKELRKENFKFDLEIQETVFFFFKNFLEDSTGVLNTALHTSLLSVFLNQFIFYLKLTLQLMASFQFAK